jgi:predicted ArsR family transcriptional regulator
MSPKRAHNHIGKKPPKSAPREAPYAYAGLQRIFHERGRLAVCTCLIAHPEGMSFTELQEACGLTDGNLARHLAALAEMDIVAVSKETGNGRPTTVCRITHAGRTRFLGYIDELESVVRDVHSQAGAGLGAHARRLPRLATT